MTGKTRIMRICAEGTREFEAEWNIRRLQAPILNRVETQERYPTPGLAPPSAAVWVLLDPSKSGPLNSKIQASPCTAYRCM